MESVGPVPSHSTASSELTTSMTAMVPCSAGRGQVLPSSHRRAPGRRSATVTAARPSRARRRRRGPTSGRPLGCTASDVRVPSSTNRCVLGAEVTGQDGHGRCSWLAPPLGSWLTTSWLGPDGPHQRRIRRRTATMFTTSAPGLDAARRGEPRLRTRSSTTVRSRTGT